MDTNTVIEGTVKFRDGKKWKSRWCVVRKLSPVADCLHLQLYRDSKERYKQGQTKASLSLENFLGIQSGFTLDKESNTLAVFCQEVIVVLAFDTREHLMQWQVKVSANLGEGDQFLVQISSAPARAKLSPGPARLLIQEFQFCLTVGVPPRLIAFWKIRQLRRFGVVEGKFCFEGGSRCGRGEGLYVLVSEKPEELKRAFDLAAEGKLSTRKNALTRNNSVMDKSRKHHTFRPDSRLSDVSSLDSTTLESPEGYDTAKTSCCSCSHSREDLLAHSHSPSHQHPHYSCDSHKFDLKSLWDAGNCDKGLGRCTSCISKIGGMSRSSTLSNTPCSRFPAWTMDRPKSCGSQKMTCSSVSLSSHSSQGSCCPSADYYHRLSAISNCSSSCSTNGNMSGSTPVECNHTPPSRPPKPAHLSFHRVQLTPSADTATSPSPSLPQMVSPSCCCNTRTVPFPSPYGNYDIPKSANFTQRNMRLSLRESPINTRLLPQITPEEFYDTPRKLKNNLICEYGNYDVPPPAQPIVNNADQDTLKTETRGSPDGTESNTNFEENVPEFSEAGCSAETPIHRVNKVKLTGEGKMPVMSPCGKIIKIPELTYEEKLDHLLENLTTDSENESSASYANISPNLNNNLLEDLLDVNKKSENIEQNYANLGLVQSLQNYENLNCVFLKPCKTVDGCSNSPEKELTSNSSKEEDIEDFDGNQKSKISSECLSVCCSNCGCSKSNSFSKPGIDQSPTHKNLEVQSSTKNLPTSAPTSCSITTESGPISSSIPPNSFVENKCNSTSCLHETMLEPLCNQENSVINQGNVEIASFSSCSVTAASSPALRRLERQVSIERILSSKLQHLSLRKRSNSADSTRLHTDEHSVNDTISTDSHGPSHISSSDSLCAVEKIEEGSGLSEKCTTLNIPEQKFAPLVISETTNFEETLESSPKRTKYFDLIGAKRSASVPNKFFCNRDSSSSNDSGVSTGSLSFRHYGPEFIEFEMPLTTSMSSKRHHIAMVNSTHGSNDEKLKVIPKRSKSVDPLRDLTFTFEFREHTNGKSTSAEAEVPVFLKDNKSKDYLSPQKSVCVTDSRSTSSGTSDMSDYFETLSFSSFSSLDVPECFRYGRTSASTMKPRSGKEYHKIDRFLLDQEAKQ